MRTASYGSPRIYAELKAQGYVCSRHRVALSRRRVQTTRSDGQHHSTPNLLARDFKADAPTRKWLVDITVVSTDEGCLYLAGVLDLFRRRLVDWAIDEHMPDDLTQAALEMAILQRQQPAQLLHHSEACCYDNAPMESFWGTFKTDLVYRQHYRTRLAAKNAIFSYIEGWYNRQRRHSSLGYLSPEQSEQQFRS